LRSPTPAAYAQLDYWSPVRSVCMIGELSSNPGCVDLIVPEWAERVLAFQLQVALCAEDLNARNSLLELRRVIVRVEDVLNLADVTLTLLAPRGWHLVAVRFDGDVAIIMGREARLREVEDDLAALPGGVAASIGSTMRLCAAMDDQVLELELGPLGLRPVRAPAD
jgi:hypothetical protein